MSGATVAAIHRIEIPGWTPASLNKVTRNHFAAHGLKQKTANVIAKATRIYPVPLVGIPKGEKNRRRALEIKGPLPGDPVPIKRRVRLEITLAKGQRGLDDDNFLKALLDALVWTGLLFNDSHVWCEPILPVTRFRGEVESTTIVLEDMPRGRGTA